MKAWPPKLAMMPGPEDPAHITDPTVISLAFDMDDVVGIQEPVELDAADDLEPVDPGDYRPLVNMGEHAEFSEIFVFCTLTNEWALPTRLTPDGPWQCCICGATDHKPKDYEGEGS